jgi:hypothetical protein
VVDIANDHNVYILGAGFSASRGLPLIATFMLELRDTWQWLKDKGREAEAKAAEVVLEFRRDSTPASYRVRIDLENVEELFSLASATGGEYLSRAMQTSIAATLEYCLEKTVLPITSFGAHFNVGRAPTSWSSRTVVTPGTSTLFTKYSVPFYEFALHLLLGGFSGPVMRQRDTIVTFNYDTLVEESLAGIGVPFSYGLGSPTYQTDESAQRLGHSGDAQMRVLKLHGSTNWAYPGTQGRKMTLFGSYDQVRKLALTPFLIPPTWNKTFTGLGDIWLEALGAIQVATRLIIIGFSIPPTDLHFKYLIAAGLRQNISLREIIFVTLDDAVLKPRVLKMFGSLDKRPRVQIINRSLSTCVNPNIDTGFIKAIARRVDERLFDVIHTINVI